MTLFYGIVTQRYTRNLILRGFCIIYLASFLSIYFQAPGLYGDNGILPARAVLENSKFKKLLDRISAKPTLLWLAPYVGLSTSAAIELLALLGAFMAFTGIVSQKVCILPWFVGLYSINYSLYLIGQAFMNKTYDEFLLEAGLIAMMLAPPTPGRNKKYNHLPEMASFWMCRWLVFRFLFSAGVGKLMSGCPKWWSLTALEYQFEVMPIPNPLSWYCHQLPKKILKLATAYSSLCEVFVPLLIFLPFRSVRLSMFRVLLFLQVCVVATGNFEHSGFLLLLMLFSFVDDEFFYGTKKPFNWTRAVDLIMGLLGCLVLIVVMVNFYNLTISAHSVDVGMPEKKVFYDLVENYLYSITFIAFTVFLTIQILAAMRHLYYNIPKVAVPHVLSVPVLALSFYLFFNSLVSIHSLHPKTNATFPNRLNYHHLHKIHIINEYNLFPTITGTDGRPEIIIEGANDLEGPWKEYYFSYKPGNVNESQGIVAPYAPKLDWQMYWAARTTYDKAPWILSFAHRLLNGVPEVLDLIKSSPFPNNPPKYIRGVLYKYKYTLWGQKTNAWWVREKVGEYFPPYTKNSPALEDFLRARNLWPSNQPQEINPIWQQFLKTIRTVVKGFDPVVLFWTVLFVAGSIVVSTSRR